MSRKRLGAATALVAVGMSLAAASDASAQTYSPRNLAYVETNNSAAGKNAILAFQRSSLGKLTPLAGSPFLTGGTGVVDLSFGLAPFANDTPVTTNADHTLLFAVNEGSNSVAVFRIAADGTLTPAPGSPFASGGHQPVSLSVAGRTLTVVNKNEGPAQASAEAGSQPNYTTFRIAATGALAPVENSTVTATASPSQALSVTAGRYRRFGFENDAALVFGADFAGGNLQSFQLTPAGVLEQNPPLALPAGPFAGKLFQGGPAPAFPLGLAAHPVFPLLYVGFVTINEIGVYDFNQYGQLGFIRTVGDPSKTGNCWLLINAAATRMYAVDTGGNQVTIYDIGTDPLAPRALGVTQLEGTGHAFELALSDDGRFLHVISQQGEPAASGGSPADNVLHVLRVDGNGFLAEVSDTPLSRYLPHAPVGTRWQGLVAF